MTTATVAPPTKREPELLRQTVVAIGGSAGIGLEVASPRRGRRGAMPTRVSRRATLVTGETLQIDDGQAAGH